MKNAVTYCVDGRMPRIAAASLFCDTARIARPTDVRCRKSCSATRARAAVSTSAAETAGTRTPPTCSSADS